MKTAVLLLAACLLCASSDAARMPVREGRSASESEGAAMMRFARLAASVTEAGDGAVDQVTGDLGSAVSDAAGAVGLGGGDDEAETPGVSDKSYKTTAALTVMLGLFGADQFYLGNYGAGILKLLTLGGCGFWNMYNFIQLFLGDVYDGDGRQVQFEFGEAY